MIIEASKKNLNTNFKVIKRFFNSINIKINPMDIKPRAIP